jgi:ABC-2 type transport system ATP-binding protein
LRGGKCCRDGQCVNERIEQNRKRLYTTGGSATILFLMDAAIRCSQLVMTYPGRPPVEAVRGLDLEVARGECFGLLGPNGAGKTTTIEVLEGLLVQTAGEVEVLGRRWGGRDDPEIRQRIGISLQETRLCEKLTVRETEPLCGGV